MYLKNFILKLLNFLKKNTKINNKFPLYYYIKWIIEFTIIISFLIIIKCIPFSLRLKILSNFCNKIGSINKNSRERILENLYYAFPEKSKNWHYYTMHNYLKKTGFLLTEYTHYTKINPKFISKWSVRLPNDEAHKKIFKPNNAAILVLGHLGHLEYMAACITNLYKGKDRLKVYAITKRQNNFLINNYIDYMRRTQNLFQYHSDENPRFALRSLSEGNILTLPADQDAGVDGPYYPFMGRLASTFEGPAFFARNSDCPIYFVWSFHNEKGQLHFDFQELERPKIKKSDTKIWNKLFTYSWVKLLEEKIRLHPQDYYWLHKRWRSQPSDHKLIWKEWNDWEKENNYQLSLSNYYETKHI